MGADPTFFWGLTLIEKVGLTPIKYIFQLIGNTYAATLLIANTDATKN
jgi:hypothetical protein